MSLPKMWMFAALQFLLHFQNSLADSDLIITLPEGQVQGVKQWSMVTNSSTEYYGFYALPYAQPPIGELRFKPPKPVEAWSGVYDATTSRSICYQVTSDSQDESEDCLHLHISVPVDPTTLDENSPLLPVLIYIHGGGFVAGAGLTSSEFFMEYGIILVMINYRVGPFGFFSTGDEVLPGNMGLKDQQLAIKWIKERIHLFGGDPDNIILTGQSAGSASVAYQILNPNSAGLFKGAICESGAAISSWAYQRNQTNITYATAGLIDERFNDDTNRNSTELLNFLLSVPASQIDNASALYSKSDNLVNLQISQGFFYAPVIEIEHEGAFLTNPMYESLVSGNFNKIPLLIGMNAEEAEQFYNEGLHWNILEFQQYPEQLVPHDMHLTGEKLTEVGNLIKDQYMQGMATDNETLARGVHYFSDQCFSRSIVRQAELHSKYDDVFFYVFSHHGLMGGNHVTFPGTGNVTHTEELPYLYAQYVESDVSGQWIRTSDFTLFPEIDVVVHNRLVKLWMNFVKYLNPTPQPDEELQNVIWPKLNIENGADFQYLDIGENLSIKTSPRGDDYKFWKKLYEDFAVPPLDTY